MAREFEMEDFAASSTPKHLGNRGWTTPNSMKANECQFNIPPVINTISIKNILNNTEPIPFKKPIKLDNKLTITPYLCPNILRETSDKECDRMEIDLKLKAETKGELLAGILDKTKICFIQFHTQVRDKDGHLILNKWSDNHFPLSEGAANCVCKLVDKAELKNCTGKNITVSVKATLSIRDWHDFNMVDLDDGFVRINHSYQ